MSDFFAVITGAGSGIGRGIARALAAKNIPVVVADINHEAALATCDLLNTTSKLGIAVRCDVTVRAELINAIEQGEKQFKKRLGIMVNNAGIALSPDAELDEKQFKKLIAINFTAVVEGTQIAWKRMEEKGGAILNIASMAGIIPQSFTPIYSGTKSAVIGFSRSLGYLDAQNGIKVMALCPNFVDTPIIDPLRDYLATQKDPILTLDVVVECATELLFDEHKTGGGSVMRILPGLKDFWPNGKKLKAKM